MSSGTEVARVGPVERRPPPFGGLSLPVFVIEVRRLLRNRRTVAFTLVLPVVFFLIFGLNKAYASQRAGSGNVSAFIMISMALYGCVVATTGSGATVSLERAAGWSRQLRVTPLTPLAYILIKMATALVLGFFADVIVYAVGIATGQPSMPVHVWALSAVVVWLGSLIFGAFGLFMGYLLPSDNVMQVMGFVLWLVSFGGGLFVPLSQFPEAVRQGAKFTPLYGLNQIVHVGLNSTPFDWTWVLNVLAWLAIFVGGAAWRFRKDTARV